MLLFIGIIAILLGILLAIINIKDIIKAKEKGDNEDVYSRAYIIRGIGLIVLGIMAIVFSFEK